MAEDVIRLDIVTPAGLLMSENVATVNLPATLGSMGVLKNHAPLMTTLDIGIVKYNQADKDHYLTVSGVFAEVKDNTVIVLAEAAERAEEINVARAQAAKARAEDRLHHRSEEKDLDMLRSELSLHRAINRIKASGLR